MSKTTKHAAGSVIDTKTLRIQKFPKQRLKLSALKRGIIAQTIGGYAGNETPDKSIHDYGKHAKIFVVDLGEEEWNLRSVLELSNHWVN